MIRSNFLHSDNHYQSGSSILESGSGQAMRASGTAILCEPGRTNWYNCLVAKYRF
jgi:hypothetical protein